ncbi:MAG: beta-lactamase family protein [Chryseobacterium sp.]|jgi:CubicO group peptidase (beta-lactamase class C family)|uniref:serine hydrolase domain-containing protein n=1 Tax=Chryseobacterium sp. TaxID=1871047 RepID=UPI0028319D68|nr:serine hydrolase domain-containing protein [Chryseobacterium sp.]MDR2236843.1 beta-lactamase family protein [Chryseobacterium sp.]
MIITRFFSALLITALFSIPVQAQKTTTYSQKIDSIITSSEPLQFTGVVLVSRNGKTEYLKAHGYRDFDQKIPLKTDDQFEIMSNSKQITAVLVLQEAQKGKIDLQTPVRKYLPELAQPWADTVTVHHLLNHTHGITDTEKPLAFKPGSQFKYGNLSYALLGKILQNTTGKKYTELANALFRKLKMDMTFCYDPQNKRSLVPGYRSENNRYQMVEGTFINEDLLSAAGVVSTVQDLAKWDQALFKGKLLSPEYQKAMMTASTQAQHSVFGKENMGFGYSVRVIREQGLDYFGITGLGDGFTCLNVYFPSTDTSLIILENQMPRNSDFWSYQEAAIKNVVLKSIKKK